MTTDDLAWVQSRLRNCTNARRQLRICAECLSVAEDTLLERLGYTSLDTFRAAHPQNKQPVCPPVERIYNPVPPEMMMESILYYYGGAPISTVRSMMGYTQTVTPEAIRHRVCNWKKKHPALAAGMPRKRPKPKKETKPMKMTYDEAGLPAYAYAKSPYTGAVVRIVRGERALFGIRDAKGRDVKAIRSMLDLEKLKSSTNRDSDIKTALDALVKDKAWAFDVGTHYPTVPDGGTAGAGAGAGTAADGVEAAFGMLNPGMKI